MPDQPYKLADLLKQNEQYSLNLFYQKDMDWLGINRISRSC